MHTMYIRCILYTSIAYYTHQVYTMYIRVYYVYQGILCISGYTMYIRAYYVYQGILCISGYTMYIRTYYVYQDVLCISRYNIIRVYYVLHGNTIMNTSRKSECVHAWLRQCQWLLEITKIRLHKL